MSFWNWYWLVVGAFSWGVFGLVAMLLLHDAMSRPGWRTVVLNVAVAVLGGPFIWLFLLCSGLAELVSLAKRRFWFR